MFKYVGIWQLSWFLLHPDFFIVIPHYAKAIAMAQLIIYLIIIVPTYNYKCLVHTIS